MESPMRALILNCTLKPSPQASNTEALARVLMAQLEADGVEAELVRAVDLTLKPGVTSDDDAMGALALEAIPEAQQEEIFTFMAQMAEFHPKDPHWYLPLIGVDCSRQSRGFGSALLAHALERCDRDHLPAYLEASSPRNKALYERHGFEVIGVIQAGSSPPMWPMLRPAR